MNKIKRDNLKTIWWNPKMVEGAEFDDDIPFCPTILTELPKEIITWEDARKIFKRKLKEGDYEYHLDVFVCFNIDDYKFDSSRGVWFCFDEALTILKHYKGVITADFSTYDDFPRPIKYFNTYRMRAFGYACGKAGLEVINNVRGSIDDIDYCFKGLPKNDVIFIGTVGSGIQYKLNRPDFEEWLTELIAEISPRTIIVLGSANYACFKNLEEQGIKIVQYDGATSKRFKKIKEMKNNEKS